MGWCVALALAVIFSNICVKFAGAFTPYEPLLTVKCNEEKAPRVQVFKNTTDYHKHQKSFRMNSNLFQGNYVAFLCNFTRLENDQFKTRESEHIIKLFLDNKNISKIKDGAFHYLDCLTHLDLQKNKIEIINKFTFYSLIRLQTLNLSYNSIGYLEDGDMVRLSNLKVLDLSHNLVWNVEHYSLANLISLVHMNLSYNLLHEFNADTFSNTPDLTTLRLDHNRIKITSYTDWRNLEKLTFLDLGYNILKTFTLSGIETLNQLTDLYLNDNHLKDIDVSNVETRFQRLRRLNINNNDFFCMDLKSIMDTLRDTNVDIIGSTEARRSNIDGVRCTIAHMTTSVVVGQKEQDQMKVRFIEELDRYDAQLKTFKTVVDCSSAFQLIIMAVNMAYKIKDTYFWTRRYIRRRNQANNDPTPGENIPLSNVSPSDLSSPVSPP